MKKELGSMAVRTGEVGTEEPGVGLLRLCVVVADGGEAVADYAR